MGSGGGSPFSSMGDMPGMSSGSKRSAGGGMPGGFGGGFGGGGGDPFGGMGGMGGFGGMGQHQHSEVKDVEKKLPCSLEDLYSGATKKLKVGAKMLNGGSEEKVLQVDVKPGWKVSSNHVGRKIVKRSFKLVEELEERSRFSFR